MLEATWPGPAVPEARAAYRRARESGLSAARSLVLGCIASFRDGWAFRSSLAKHTGLSVRTVQRAITQGKDFGLIGTARAKPDEVPPGAKGPMPCGWSHRWTVGWGQAYEAAKSAVAQTRLARLVKAAARGDAKPSPKPAAAAPSGPMQGPRQERAPRRWTVEELDAELERLAQVKPPPE
jgi:hypothetical protein